MNANTRLLQRSFFIQFLALEVLEKDIKGLKRKERIREQKKIEAENFCIIYMRNFAIFKYKIKLRKKMQFFLVIAKINVALIGTLWCKFPQRIETKNTTC